MKNFFGIACLVALSFNAWGEELYQKYQPQKTSRVREATEWSNFNSTNTLDTTKPRLLLIGDSIVAGYNGTVREWIKDQMNLSFWASSKCVTDADYFKELDLVLGAANYQVISFNNGLHSLFTDRAEWEEAYRGAVKLIRAKCPNAKLYLTNCTPLKDPALTAKAMELNALIQKVAEEQELPIIDLFGLMNPLDRDTYWSDTFHYKRPGIELEAKRIVDTVLEEKR